MPEVLAVLMAPANHLHIMVHISAVVLVCVHSTSVIEDEVLRAGYAASYWPSLLDL